MTRKPPIDIYQQVTDAIVAAIDSNPGEYRMPWQRSGIGLTLPVNALTNNAYNGINVIALWCTAAERGYVGPSRWATFRQWLELKKPVLAGEKGTPICFYKQYDVEPSADNPDDDGKRLVAKHTHVFHESQTQGYLPPPEAPAMPPLERHGLMRALLEATGADVRVGGEAAFYVPSADFIQLPDEKHFTQDDAGERTFQFESTAAHELTHWSGNPKRLARDLSGRFGTSGYAFEELVAELGAAYLCAELGICAEPRKDHAQYLLHWLTVMKLDKKAIFTAAAKAAEAARYLMGFMPKEAQNAA